MNHDFKTLEDLIEYMGWTPHILFELAKEFMLDKELGEDFFAYCLTLTESLTEELSDEDLYDLLTSANILVKETDIATWSKEQKLLAEEWITIELINKGSNSEVFPPQPKPEFL